MPEFISEQSELIDLKSAARLMSVSVPTVRRLIQSAAAADRPPLPAKHIARCVRIKRSDLMKWIDAAPSVVKPRRGRPKGATKAMMKARSAAEAALTAVK
ncbi:MAG TPA: helix-turn-helix domain-containing protein [Acidiphilium sp.]|nr:helix-turn-helix domain-containing protein [Acidiphilium sp.]HQT90264.1 helix-turn-helix domain-containing protein [Acidiphilium sp.]